jgi:parallel beta-helix repeat protein
MIAIGRIGLILLSSCLLPATALMADAAASTRTFYVDFEGGSDDNGGLSPQAALKHCPGDPAAAAKVNEIPLQPGDTVLFKGGVTYRGSIVVNSSGAEESPITFDGNSGRYGQGRAVIDGSEIVSGWQACKSAEEAGGNPNWKNIYWAWLSAPVAPFSSNMYQGEKMCWLAQDPNPRDPFYQDRSDGHRKIVQATANTITDPQVFTQPEADAWVGAWLIVYADPNYAYFVKVTAYDPAAHRVTHSGNLTNPTSYAVLNSLRCLHTAGEYVLRDEQGRQRVFLWPHAAEELLKTGASVSRRGTGFIVAGRRHVVIQGFTIQKFCADEQAAMGVQVSKGEFITVRDNDVRFGNHGRTGGVAHGAGIGVYDGRDVLVENNRVCENRRCCGILVHPAKRCVVRGNLVRKSGYVGIWLMRTAQSQVVGNTVTDNHGVHSNAISIYVDCADILIAGNRVSHADRPLTLQDSDNVFVINNSLVSDTTLAVGLWSGRPHRNLLFLNNLILGPANQGIYAVNKVVTGCTFENNIIGSFFGEAAIEGKTNKFRNNIYLDPRQGLFDASEKKVADDKDLFVASEKEDYHLKAGSPAVDAGADVSGLYPKAAFPDYDFDKDLDGRPRMQGPAVDIGPYEHVPGK